MERIFCASSLIWLWLLLMLLTPACVLSFLWWGMRSGQLPSPRRSAALALEGAIPESNGLPEGSAKEARYDV